MFVYTVTTVIQETVLSLYCTALGVSCPVTPPLLCKFPSDDGAGSDKILDCCAHWNCTVPYKTALNAATLQSTEQMLRLVQHCKALYSTVD